MNCDLLLTNIALWTVDGLVTSQAIAITQGYISWCGAMQQLPEPINSQETMDCQEKLLTPGLVDCHTHLVYAGDRANEFAKRLAGMDYAAIAKEGGGILSTVKSVRQASEEVLFMQSLPRLQALLAEGVTTVEIKSGYGLDFNNEIKMLKTARRLGEALGMRIKTTFLGAHALPPEYANRRQAYVDYLCQEMMPAIAELQLVDAVDVFCEHIAFDLKQTEQIFCTAKALKLPIKCHAEQLSLLGSAYLAASNNALSCDHIEYIDEIGVQQMAQKGTVAVLLPGAFYFLKEKKIPPIALLREYGVRMALATDCNPGSSPTTSLLLMMSMACHYFGISIQEAINGVTVHAATALGIAEEVGTIAVGKIADLVLWEISEPSLLCYYFGSPVPHKTIIKGQWLSTQGEV